MNNEIKHLSRLSNGNIVKMTKIVFTLQTGRVGYVMEKADTSLYHYIMNYRAQTPRPTSLNRRIGNKLVRGILYGLDYLHSDAKVKHGDLNPNNILIKGNNEVLISDFGTASDSEESSSKHAGTGPFRNREQYLHEEWDVSADVHSFGMTIYFVFDMKLPFEQTRNPNSPVGQQYGVACDLLHGESINGIHYRPEVDAAKFGILHELVTSCWNPVNRWTIQQARTSFNEWIANRQLPM